MAATLVIFKKNGERKDIPIKPGVVTIGRRPDCDLRVPLPTVSRRHCRIVQKDDKTVVQDLGSANGTFINSQRIMEGVITAGDILSVGSIVFTVQIDGKPQHIAPPEVKHDPLNDPAMDSSVNDLSGTGSSTQLKSPSDEASDPLVDLEPLAGGLDDSSN